MGLELKGNIIGTQFHPEKSKEAGDEVIKYFISLIHGWITIIKSIIPALDLYNGNIVRLFQGDFERITTYSNKPIEIIKRFLQFGASKIHIINLNGAKSGELKNCPNYKMLIHLIYECKKFGCKIQYGGGIRTERSIKDLLDLGVDKVIIGTLSFDRNGLLKNLFYKDNIIIALDVLNKILMIRGWTHDTKIEITSHFKN